MVIKVMLLNRGSFDFDFDYSILVKEQLKNWNVLKHEINNASFRSVCLDSGFSKSLPSYFP